MLKRNKFRIALTEAGLAKGSLWVNGIPIPSVAPYRDHSVIVGKSDGSNQEYGFKNVTLMWDKLTYEMGKRLQDLVEGSRTGTGILYLTISRANGTGSGQDWIDVSGRAARCAHRGRSSQSEGVWYLQQPNARSEQYNRG